MSAADVAPATRGGRGGSVHLQGTASAAATGTSAATAAGVAATAVPGTSAAAAVEAALRAAGATGSLTQAVTAAMGQRVDGAGIERLLQILAGRGTRNPVGLLLHLLRNGEARQTLDADAKKPAPAPNATRTGSSMAAVSASDPYGWQGRGASALQECYDHNEPGTWNPYRQSHNLSTAERQAAGAPDHRRRGCSRADVCGTYGRGTDPTPEYDAAAVEIAKESPRD